MAMGAKLRNYKFNKYFVNKKDDHKVHLKKLTFLTNAYAKIDKLLKENLAAIEGVYLAKDLVSMPPNIMYPATFAEECKKLEKLGVKVSVLREKDMEKLGMNALLGVGRGSERESHLVVLEWYGHPKGKKEQPIAFVGKGVTFDTGGISLKPATNMADMKYDMAGAGAVAGLMKALAGRKAKVNVIGVMGLVENMPSGSAQRPSDVVVSMSGQTIEVDNTDAEGRLVLSDALWYTQDKFKPKFMVDLATLTGAVVIALGENCYAGLYANDEKLAQQLREAGDKVGEFLWRMPLKEHYDKQINSEIADVRNTGSGRGGGSITAAQFLQRFVNKCTWAHLDIAGVAWDKNGSDLCSKGATGFGVRLLNQFILDNYEAK
jgi:leucyl aminopeptidase